MGNWFPKGEYVRDVVAHWKRLKSHRRGLVMGIWTSCQPFGNIAGSLVAGGLLSYGWFVHVILLM